MLWKHPSPAKYVSITCTPPGSLSLHLCTHLVQLVVPEVEHTEGAQVGQRAGQTGERVLVERQRLEAGEAAELGWQRGQFVAVQVELGEVRQIAHGRRQLSDLYTGGKE